jgi:hypothetical protein
MAGRYALSGHFSFQERFFVAEPPSHSRAAKNAAMAVLVAFRWLCRTWPICGNERTDVDRLMLSKLSSWHQVGDCWL